MFYGVIMDNKTELERIKVALEALLNQMVEIDCAPREPTKPDELRFKIMNNGPVPAGIEIQIRELLERPVRSACKHAITLLGKRVHELLGDHDAMVAVAEEVAVDGQQYGHRASILNWAWDGIGGWTRGCLEGRASPHLRMEALVRLLGEARMDDPPPKLSDPGRAVPPRVAR
jgi:hypothetical protein